MPKRNYDSTVARVAGNIAAGLLEDLDDSALAMKAVRLARAIVAEVEATEPKEGAGSWTIEDDVQTEARPKEAV